MVFLFNFEKNALWPNAMILQLKPYYKLSGIIRKINVVKDLLETHFENVSSGFCNYLEAQLGRLQVEFEVLTSVGDIHEPVRVNLTLLFVVEIIIEC